MATQMSPTQNPSGSRQAAEIFPAFPDTDAWAMRWDGEALGQPPTGMNVVKQSKPHSPTGGRSWEKR